MQINWKTNTNGSPYLFRQQAKWTGVKVHRARVLPGELLEHSLPCHEISITLGGSLMKQKQSATGKWIKTRGTVGSFCFTPAGQIVAASWNEEMENLGIDLDASFVRQIALENHFPSNFEFIETDEKRDALIEQIGLALLAEANAKTPNGISTPTAWRKRLFFIF